MNAEQLHNPNCDGSGPCTMKEVRRLPTGGDGAVIVCHACYGREMMFRTDRNQDLSKDCQFELPAWLTLEVYETN